MQVKSHERKWRWQSRAIASVCIAIGGISIEWALAGRLEYGGFQERVEWFQEAFDTDRVFYAFVVDAGLYGFWQAWLMNDAGAPRRYCAVPFFGLAIWLLAGRPRD